MFGSIIAAVAALFVLQPGQLDLPAYIMLAGFGVALIAELASLVHQPEAAWFEGRAMAESTKTLAWRYAVCGDPFPQDLDDVQADALFRKRLEDVSEQTSVGRLAHSIDPLITERMRDLRRGDFEERRKAYIQGRTMEQVAWYDAKARFNATRATAWRVGLIIAEIAALISAILYVVNVWQPNLAGLMATAIAAGGAWLGLKQFSPLAASYALAARELMFQADDLRRVPESGWAAAVADAEEAISREHTMWVASRAGRKSIR